MEIVKGIYDLAIVLGIAVAPSAIVTYVTLREGE